MLTWQNPWWFLGVALALLLYAFARLAASDTRRAASLTLLHPAFSKMRAASIERAPAPYRKFPVPLVIALFSLALAQPVWQGAWLKQAPLGREVLLLVDASKSMSIDDFKIGGQAVERLSVLKGLINQFVEARSGDKFGLVIFGDHAATLLPPTFDHELVQTMLARVPVGITGENTALGDAIGLALNTIQQRSPRRPALILFTDGDSTAGIISPREATALAARLKIPVYTVKVGTDLFGHALRPGTDFSLPQIAAASGARYYTATSTQMLQDVIKDIGTLERTVTPPSNKRELHALYWLPLLFAISILVIVRASQAREQIA